jgi:hypothetical protein
MKLMRAKLQRLMTFRLGKLLNIFYNLLVVDPNLFFERINVMFNGQLLLNLVQNIIDYFFARLHYFLHGFGRR